MAPVMLTPDEAARAATRVVDRPEDRCWPWPGHIGAKGYGSFSFKRHGSPTSTPAHRAVYQALVGPIPDGLELDHECENKGCVNPAHLTPVTHLENVRRSGERELARFELFALDYPSFGEAVDAWFARKEQHA